MSPRLNPPILVALSAPHRVPFHGCEQPEIIWHFERSNILWFRIERSPQLLSSRVLDNWGNAKIAFLFRVLQNCREGNFSGSLRSAPNCFGCPRQIQVPGGTHFVQAADGHLVGCTPD